MSDAILLGDIGGTNARFAVSEAPGQVRAIRSYRAAEYPRFTDALARYLSELRTEGVASFKAIRIAAAGPIEPTGEVTLTNSPWRISNRELSAILGVNDTHLVNDLEAVALALPHLPPNELRPIASVDGRNEPTGNLLAVNIGTGFGAAVALVPPRGPPSAIATEAGHMTFAATTDDEAILIANLHSIEDFLSGAGIANAYRIFNSTDPTTALPDLENAAEVFAVSTNNPAASRTVRAFTGLLARVAGDLVLATGSWGGCYFCGSVIQGWIDHADEQHFSTTFAAKGKMSDRMACVPSRLILSPQPALFGLSFTP